MIREALDCGTEFPSCTPHSVAEVLVDFIAALPEPLLPYELYPTVIHHVKIIMMVRLMMMIRDHLLLCIAIRVKLSLLIFGCGRGGFWRHCRHSTTMPLCTFSPS